MVSPETAYTETTKPDSAGCNYIFEHTHIFTYAYNSNNQRKKAISVKDERHMGGPGRRKGGGLSDMILLQLKHFKS